MERAAPRVALPFWLLAASAFLIPVLPRLVAQGMFMDGLWYAVIARNMAIGVGSLWRPMFTPTIRPGFFADHPPLGFAIESLFFRAFGDHWWVAKLYSGATALATAALIVLLFREAERRVGGARMGGAGWLPVLFWVATPVVTWSFSQNMLENTMGLFVLLAAWAFVRASDSRRWPAFSTLAGAALFAAILSKGFAGLFPLAFPAILALTLRRPSPGRALAQTVLALAVLGALCAVVFAAGDARVFAERYLGGNFIGVVSGARGGVANRLHIVNKLFLELLPGLIVFGLMWFAGRGRGGAAAVPGRARVAAAFLGLGLAGSLPIALSPIQSGFYLVPCFPAFAVGLAVLVRPAAEAMMAWLRAHDLARRAFTAATAALLVGTLAFSLGRAGGFERDATVIGDVRAIGTIVPPGSTVAACSEMIGDWSLFGYLGLYDRIDMEPRPEGHAFAVVREGACDSLPGYVPVDLATKRVRLFRAE